MRKALKCVIWSGGGQAFFSTKILQNFNLTLNRASNLAVEQNIQIMEFFFLKKRKRAVFLARKNSEQYVMRTGEERDKQDFLKCE